MLHQVRYVSVLADGGLIALSNYRVVLRQCGRYHHLPLGVMDTVVVTSDTAGLLLQCKDANSYW